MIKVNGVSDDIRLGNISGRARPVGRMARTFAALRGHGGSAELARVIDDEVIVDSLSRLLTEAIETEASNNGGKVDTRAVATRILAEMRRHPK